uniref:Uncharacterized protein n=1 Tax=Rhizophora mucronata TaxID=61149 RepID=A0A2P2JMI7_RHIMU
MLLSLLVLYPAKYPLAPPIIVIQRATIVPILLQTQSQDPSRKRKKRLPLKTRLPCHRRQ